MVDIRIAPTLALHNKAKLEHVKECACYFCFKVFSPSEIIDFTDKDHDTAICPYCDNDCVIPVYDDTDKDVETLHKIHKYWF